MQPFKNLYLSVVYLGTSTLIGLFLSFFLKALWVYDAFFSDNLNGFDKAGREAINMVAGWTALILSYVLAAIVIFFLIALLGYWLVKTAIESQSYSRKQPPAPSSVLNGPEEGTPTPSRLSLNDLEELEKNVKANRLLAESLRQGNEVLKSQLRDYYLE